MASFEAIELRPIRWGNTREAPPFRVGAQPLLRVETVAVAASVAWLQR